MAPPVAACSVRRLSDAALLLERAVGGEAGDVLDVDEHGDPLRIGNHRPAYGDGVRAPAECWSPDGSRGLAAARHSRHVVAGHGPDKRTADSATFGEETAEAVEPVRGCGRGTVSACPV